MKKDVDLELHDAPIGSVTRRTPDIDKITKFVGWTPQTNLDEGIKNTLEAMT